MLLTEFFNQILTEADVFDPLCPDPNKAGCSTVLQKWILEMNDDISGQNPKIDHTAFLERLGRDIINNNRIFGANTAMTALEPYTPNPHGKDPDWVKQKPPGTIFTVSEKALTYLENDLFDLFLPDEDAGIKALFNQFHEKITNPRLDMDIKNKLLPIKKKYEATDQGQGTYDLPGLKKAMQIMTTLGAQKWKHDKVEKARLQSEAPIIMKFKNGYMWVRLDSEDEMQREGGMMQNCLTDYCPVSTIRTNEFQEAYEAWEEDGRPGGEEYETDIVVEWIRENLAGDFESRLEEKGVDLDNFAEEMLNTVGWEDRGEEDPTTRVGMYIGKLIYSLRDKNGEAHVSAEYDPTEDMNHLEPLEVLGKQNSPPIAKYQGYVDELNNFFSEHPETFGPAGATRDEPLHPDY